MQMRVETWNGEKLRAFRLHLGYSQQRLAQELGTTQPRVCLWEGGKYHHFSKTTVLLLNLLAERAGFVYLKEELHHVGDE